MGFVDAMMNLLGYTKATNVPDPGALYPPSPQNGVVYGGPLTFPGWPDRAGERQITPGMRQRMAMQSAWAYSDIQLVAQELATANLKVLERQAGTEEPAEVVNHPFELLWKAPNPHMGRAFVAIFWTYQLMLRGEGYLFFAPADNSIELLELWPVPSSMMTPVPDVLDFVSSYEFRSHPKAKPIFIPAEYICRTWFPDPDDLRKALAPLDAAADGIEMDFNQAKWNKNFFGKENAIPAHVVSAHKDMTSTDFIRFKSELFDFFGGGQRRTFVTRAGDVDFKTLTALHKDMEFMSGRLFNRDEIDRAFGFPGGFWTANATEANQRGAKAVVIENVVWPKLVLLAENLTTQILGRWYGTQYIAEFNDIRPRNVELELRQQDANKIILSVNELRKAQGKEPFQGWIWDNVPADVALRAWTPEPTTPIVPPALPTPMEPQQARQDSLEDIDDVPEDDAKDDLKAIDLARWQRKALKRLRDGRSAGCRFDSPHLDPELVDEVQGALSRCTTGQSVKSVFKALELTEREQKLYDALAAILQRYSKQTLKTIQAGEQIDLSHLDADLRAALLPALLEVVLEDATALAEAIGPDFDPAVMATTASTWASNYSFELVKGLTERTRTIVQKATSQFLQTPGMTREQLETLLRPAFGPVRAEAIAVTEPTRAAAQGTLMYKSYLSDMSIETEQIWRTSSDEISGRCELCGPRNGKVTDEVPPAHPRCRCRITLRIVKRAKSDE